MVIIVLLHLRYSLRVDLKRKSEDDDVLPSVKRKEKVKELYIEYRARLKDNKTLYKEYKKKDALKKESTVNLLHRNKRR